MPPTGRTKKIGPKHHPLLREIVIAEPLASVSEIGAAFTRRANVQVHRNTLAEALAEAGIKRTHEPRTTAENMPRSSRIIRAVMAMPPPIGRRRHPIAIPARCPRALVADLFEVTGRGQAAGLSASSAGRCLLLCDAYELRLAPSARRFSALAKRLSHVPALDGSRLIRSHARSAPRTVTRPRSLRASPI